MDNFFYFDWEATCLRLLQHLDDGTILEPLLSTLNNICSAFGEEYVAIAILGLIYWGFNKEKGKRIGLILIMSSVSNGMLKNAFHRLRPYLVLPNIKLLRNVDGYSFPSGHSANAGSLYPSLAYEFREKKWKWLTRVAILLPLLIALSRIYLGAHWPTDVIVGLMQGLIFFVILEFLSTKLKNPKLLYLLCIIIALPGFFFCETKDYFASLGLLFGFVCGTCFEEAYVDFENTNNWKQAIFRTLGGGMCFGVLNVLLKLIFDGLFPADTFGFYLMRVIRYTIVTFTLVGVYPMLFRIIKKRNM